ncbi:protoheme IX farnesyltransferase [Sphingomonas sp. 28-63-12]|uniref:heme o synthase n=1 Tax=Sphingomonas sp. 28-63-12 TaxID=1970434 RepID=UPI000BC39273|nr:MAG: protoheme IX farnesyltransferase [Sphingomonas sp. 28-63-12]
MTTTTLSPSIPADWRDFLALTKPRVMRSVVFTGLCGMLVAPVALPPAIAFTAILAIALAAGAAGTLNQWYESDIDALMKRTAKRPLAAGRMDRDSALHFGVGVGVFSVLLMGLVVNLIAAAFLAVSILFYVVIYTIGLKRYTPQNIVIGGAAGAFPPMIGWVAATGSLSLLPILMFSLIFLWTPPHSWALALLIRDDYAKGGVPMMPVVAGARTTRWQMLGYAVAMAVVAIAPWPLGLAGGFYGVVASIASAVFVGLTVWVVAVAAPTPATMKPERVLFVYSIGYILAMFAALVVDRWMV